MHEIGGFIKEKSEVLALMLYLFLISHFCNCLDGEIINF